MIGLRPTILVSSTRFRRYAASRSSRHSFARATNFPSSPCPAIGFFIHASSVRNENRVASNRAASKVAIATRFAPTGLKAARNPSARTLPSTPPEGSEPRTWGIFTRLNSAESDPTISAHPTSLAIGVSIGWLRNHRIARINMPAGNRNAA